jgi:hypothetical protein
VEFLIQDQELDYVLGTGGVMGPGTIHHYALVRQGSLGLLYVDGAPAGQDSNPNLDDVSNPHDLYFAVDPRRDIGGFDWAAITLDEVSLYHRALSASEIAAIYNSGQAGKYNPLPVVPGLAVESYAIVTNPFKISFDAAGGLLFVGQDFAAPARIHRVSPGASLVVAYGPVMADPDAVLFDATGTISGMAGSVLVGNGLTATHGQVDVIRPDETTAVLVGPSNQIPNPADLAFDPAGRLVILADDSGTGAGSSARWDGATLTTLATFPVRMGSLALDSAGRMYVGGKDGTVRLLDANGGVLSPALVTGLGPNEPPLAIGPSGSHWRSDLYSIRRTTGEMLRVDPLGAESVIGTGFHGLIMDAAFGPDGALYLSHLSEGRILRVGTQDRDGDGLTDQQEASLRTDPDDADTDDDGLLDGTEVNMAMGGGCPSPLDADSDGDGLSDGDEVSFVGTDPCNPDTDGDGVNDFVDPLPLTPGVTSSWLEAALYLNLIILLEP